MLPLLRIVAAATLMLCGCSETPQTPYCYGTPDVEFAPHRATEAPVWVVPDWAFVRPPDAQVFTHTWLPWDYNRRAVYPIEAGAPVLFRLRFMAGQSIANADVVRVAFFVEGRPVPVDIGGDVSTVHTVTLENGLGQAVIEIAPDQLQPGLNQVDAIATYRLDGFWSPKPTNSFTVANGSLVPQSYADTPLPVGTAPDNQRFATFTDPESGLERMLYGRQAEEFVSRLRGNLNVTLHLWPSAPDADCEGGFDRFALVALRDGVPEPIGDHERIVVTMAHGEQRELRYSLPLWSDTGRHNYLAVTLPGLGRPVRRSDGAAAASQGSSGPLNFTWDGSL